MHFFYRVASSLTLLVLLAAFATAQTSKPAHGEAEPALSCSPAPCVLTPIQATQGGFDAPIAADPTNPQNLIVGNDYTGCPYPTNSGFNLTFDGGSNWGDLFCMQPLFYDGVEYGGGGSPILGYDSNGVAYIGSYYADEQGESPYEFEAFQKSSDGVNWSAPAPAVFRGYYYPFYCWMAVDDNAGSPYVNAVYVSCILLGQGGGPQVVVSHSIDGGATWHQVNVAPPQRFPDADYYTTMTVGRDGTVYLVWQYCTQDNACDNGPVYMVFSKSSDGGDTWSTPQLVAKADVIYPLPHSKRVFVPDGPVIAVDASSGPNSGNLYVAMYNWTGTFMQLQVVRSTDGGSTWSKPVPVAPGITHDQFLPWLTVSSTGVVGASWLDRRNDPKNIDYQAYAGISYDGGLTFDNVQLTTAFSDPNKGTANQGIGDYTGNTWDGPNIFVAAWMDNSQSTYNEDFVGGIRLK